MSVTVTTELTIKPGAGQTQEEAETEFVRLFRDYLTLKDSAFQADYGPEPWGGYQGPTVASVVVRGPDEPSHEAPSRAAA
jgi:hypothetical protein